MNRWLCGAAMGWLGCAGNAAHAACLSDTQVTAVVAQFMDKQPAANPVGLSRADGQCTRAKVNRLLEQNLGRPVGYKVGLTNPAVQQRFNHPAPVWGRLYAPMLLPSDNTLDAAFGVRPMFEADLLVRVSEVRVNHARTPKEVLDGIDRVIPFIELPDLLAQDPTKLDGAAIEALNVGARLGITGEPIVVARTAQFADALRDMQVVLLVNGAEAERAKGSDVLEHPLNAVIWLAQELAREGISLRKGDLVSVGSFSKLMPPKPGMRVEVRYEGLAGNPAVNVTFK